MSFVMIIFLTTLSYLMNSCSLIQTLQECYLVEMGNYYYGVYIENDKRDDEPPKNFFGVCDSDTLSRWQPCPFKLDKGFTYDNVCNQSVELIQSKPCDIRAVVMQPQCNCSGSLKDRQLQSIPNFPTCLLGDPLRQCKSKCTSAIRRSARTALVINNCIQCMTKHPDVEMARVALLDWNRVKRGEVAPSSNYVKKRKLLNCQHPGFGSCSLNRKDQSYVPKDFTNKPLSNDEETNSEVALEQNSNIALIRLIRTLSKKRKPSRIQLRQVNSGEDDDDDEDDDDAGEDIAIEEDEDAEKKLSTTEEAEKDELRQQQHQAPVNYNLTENVNQEEEEKVEEKSSKGLKENSLKSLLPAIYTINLLLKCVVKFCN